MQTKNNTKLNMTEIIKNSYDKKRYYKLNSHKLSSYNKIKYIKRSYDLLKAPEDQSKTNICGKQPKINDLNKKQTSIDVWLEIIKKLQYFPNFVWYNKLQFHVYLFKRCT